MTKVQFKKLNRKLDSILEHSNALSLTKWENLLTTHRATVEMLTSTNVKLIEESSMAIHDSKKMITEVTKKVRKLHQEVQTFINDFRKSLDKNTANMNKVIEGFLLSLKAVKDSLSKIAEAKNVKLVLETQKSLFVAWSHERIQKEAIDDSNI
ncbi:unnamed protein product [Lactuca saligna]|uniref:Uncharacterized protein n=1 Tax=Lactuca saligna TaxID=75948 RepID=A0AA35Y8P9_LACSI|nr:unnamed protein product [Lactuca saligna]